MARDVSQLCIDLQPYPESLYSDYIKHAVIVRQLHTVSRLTTVGSECQ